MPKLNQYLKTAILLIILFQIAPSTISKLSHHWHTHIQQHNKIAYINIEGYVQDAAPYRKHLIQYFKDSSIKGILVVIQSHGSAPGSAQALAFDIENLKKEFPKPIITYVENVCTGTSYEIAAATDYIVAPGAAIIGDIGNNITSLFEIQDFLKLKNGTDQEPIDITANDINSQTYKKCSNPFASMTNEQRTMLQSVADNTYQQLTKQIAAKRHLQLNRIDQWANNKIFTCQQAYDLKLIDAIGTKITAVNLLKKNIIPSDRPIEWVKPCQESFFSFLWDTTKHDVDLDVL